MIQFLSLGLAILALLEIKEHHEWIRDHYKELNMLAKLICSIFLFVLKLFKQVVTAVGEAIKVVADVLVDVLDDVATAIFGSGSLLTWLIVGGAAYLMLSNEEEEKKDVEPIKQQG